MRRRMPLVLSLAAALLVGVAAPVSGATTTKVAIDTTGIWASSSNARFDDAGTYLPGTYRESYVSGFHGVWTSDHVAYLDETVALAAYWQITVDDAGNITQDWSYQGAVVPETFTVDEKLTSGRLVASIPAYGCLAWDETGACTASGEAGTFEVDLTATGIGRPMNTPSNAHGSTGVPGAVRIAYGGASMTRSADITGTFTWKGDSAIVGTWDISEMSDGMGIEVIVSN